MNHTISETSNTPNRAKAASRSGVLLTIAAIVWISSGSSLAVAQGPKANAGLETDAEFKNFVRGSWAGQGPHAGYRLFVGADEIRWYQDVQIAHEKLTEKDEKIEANGLTYHLHYAVKVSFAAVNGLFLRPDAKTIRRGVKTAQAALSYKVEVIDPGTIKFTPWKVHDPAGDAVTMKRDNLIGGLKGGSGNVDLQRGVKYYSPNGQYYFEWQKDGNFVLKKTADGTFLWGMNLVRKDFSYIKIMRLQPTGNFVARGGEGPGDFMWAALKSDPGPTQLIATDDGKLQLRLISTGSHLWSVP